MDQWKQKRSNNYSNINGLMEVSSVQAGLVDKHWGGCVGSMPSLWAPALVTTFRAARVEVLRTLRALLPVVLSVCYILD